jgi:hypothetical protein
MRNYQRAPVGPRFQARFTNGQWVVLDRVTYNHRPFSLAKLANAEAALQNSKGLPW